MKLRCTTNSRDFKETLHMIRAKCDRNFIVLLYVYCHYKVLKFRLSYGNLIAFLQELNDRLLEINFLFFSHSLPGFTRKIRRFVFGTSDNHQPFTI